MLVGAISAGRANTPGPVVVLLAISPNIPACIALFAGAGGCRSHGRKMGWAMSTIEGTIHRSTYELCLDRQLRSGRCLGMDPPSSQRRAAAKGSLPRGATKAASAVENGPIHPTGVSCSRKYQPLGLTGGVASAMHQSSPSSKCAICRLGFVAFVMVLRQRRALAVLLGCWHAARLAPLE